MPMIDKFEDEVVGRIQERRGAPVIPEHRDRGLRSCSTRLRRVCSAGVVTVCAVLMLFLPAVALAQIGGSGTIEGTVTDSSGAVVPGAKITARNVATGAEMVRTSNSDGRYNISPLDVGEYTVKISAKGFETLLREKLELNGMQVLPLDVALQAGAADVTVTVTAAPPPLETENATLGATMEHEAYTSLPLEMGGANGVSTDQRRVTDYADHHAGRDQQRDQEQRIG